MTTTRIRWFNAILHRGPGYQLPSQSEADLRAALTTLAERWEEIAAKATTDLGRERAMQIEAAAKGVRYVLATGHVPHWLMTDAELEQYGTPEATS